MAKASGNSTNGAGEREGEVSNCISNLIHAFTNGLDIFKRLRERRRKRKSRKHGGSGGHGEQSSGPELQLSNSLRRGPMDIQSSYEKHYGKAGETFAKGDPIAHASLAETLIKLNTGLVGIIAAFLNHDSKAHHLNLDYKSLTHLSDSSRAEAINSMNQLYQRLSQSQLQVYRIGACPRCGSSNHQNCSGAHSNKESRTSSRTRTSGPTVARIPVKSSSTTVLAVVRPRNARKSSSSSASSAKSQSTALNSPYASPLGSPLPQYAPKDPFPLQPVKKPQLPAARKRVDSHGAARPTTWPHTKPDNTFPLQAPPRPPKLPISKSPAPAKSPVLREKSTSPSAATPLKRRIDKATPSTYTFASDSTKLGEIPQRNWAVPFDYAEAERLNAEALVNGYPGVSADEKPKTKKGLFKFLRRGTAVSS